MSRLILSTSLDDIYAFFKTTFDIQKENLFASKIIPKHRDLATVSFIVYLIKLDAHRKTLVKCFVVKSGQLVL